MPVVPVDSLWLTSKHTYCTGGFLMLDISTVCGRAATHGHVTDGVALAVPPPVAQDRQRVRKLDMRRLRGSKCTVSQSKRSEIEAESKFDPASSPE